MGPRQNRYVLSEWPSDDETKRPGWAVLDMTGKDDPRVRGSHAAALSCMRALNRGRDEGEAPRTSRLADADACTLDWLRLAGTATAREVAVGVYGGRGVARTSGRSRAYSSLRRLELLGKVAKCPAAGIGLCNRPIVYFAVV